MNIRQILQTNIADIIELYNGIDDNIIETFSYICEECISAIRNGNKIIFCGNGGSAADAQHFAAELLGRFYKNRKPLPALALSTNTSIITAIGNDFGFETIFSKQIKGLGQSGDVLIAISTSGNSKNLVEGVSTAKHKEIYTVGFLGNEGGLLKDMVDIALVIKSSDTPRIQEMHEFLGHTLCQIIETEICK